MATDREILEAQAEYGLGAIPNLDPRNREYPVRALFDQLPQGTTLPDRSYTWACNIALNQKTTGTCVGHGGEHELLCRPQLWPPGKHITAEGLSYFAKLLYQECCKIDPWTQNDNGDVNFGTDTVSLGKVMTRLGFWKEYRWAFSHQEVRTARGYQGPGIWAIPWYNSMFYPNAAGEIEVNEGSGLAGWHALLGNGQSVSARNGRVHNSWGPLWGVNGEAFISWEGEEKLMGLGGSFLVPVGRTRV